MSELNSERSDGSENTENGTRPNSPPDVKPDVKSICVTSNETEDNTAIRWPGSWQDGTRKSAFLPYRPTTVLTNLQRGNIQTQTPVVEPIDVSLHHRAGQGEVTLEDIQQETNIDSEDCHGLTPLMWASSYGQLPTVQLLLQHGATLDHVGSEGETALQLAAAGGHHDVVRLLLTQGADVNHTDENGTTALMFAAHGNHPHCVNELLLRGANLMMTNLCGDTAFKIAVSRGSKLAQAVIENYLLTLLS